MSKLCFPRSSTIHAGLYPSCSPPPATFHDPPSFSPPHLHPLFPGRGYGVRVEGGVTTGRGRAGEGLGLAPRFCMVGRRRVFQAEQIKSFGDYYDYFYRSNDPGVQTVLGGADGQRIHRRLPPPRARSFSSCSQQRRRGWCPRP